MKKIKAGALQLTVFITIVVMLLLFAFVLLLNLHNRIKFKKDQIIKLAEVVSDVIDEDLSNGYDTSDSLWQKRAEFELVTHTSHWGIFDKIYSRGGFKNTKLVKTAMVGKRIGKERTALYLEENNRSLVVVGKTRIEGFAYLPKRGIKTGNISGVSYYGKQLIYGNAKESKELIKCNRQIIERMEELLEYQTADVNIIEMVEGIATRNSFKNPTEIIFQTNDLHLDQEIKGNVIVMAKNKIFVSNKSKLEDVILVSPTIEIQNGVSGRFQAIASEYISVGNNCKLQYPSSLVLLPKKKNSSVSQARQDSLLNPSSHNITLGKDSRIDGVLFYFAEEKEPDLQPQIFIEENSEVRGEVYCSDNLELRGNVFGSVYTANFIARQSGSVYQNHIYNGVINGNKLPREYVGLNLIDGKKQIAKWLY